MILTYSLEWTGGAPQFYRHKQLIGPTDVIEDLNRLTATANHWKANHDRMLKIKRAVLDRPDLKERAAKVIELSTRIAELEAQLEMIKFMPKAH